MTLSAKVLGLALAAEVLTLLVFDVAVLARNGFHGFSLDVFKPSVVFAGGFGLSLMLAFGSFVGFEATALYGEESRNPHRSVPRVTYISLALITVFYLVTSWAAISSYGVHHAQAAAAANPSVFIFAANARYVGGFTTDAMQILVVTSLFAAFLAFCCNTARYHLALSRDGLLPRAMSRTHPKYGSPVVASAAQLGLLAAVVIGFTLAGQNPYLGMGTSLYGLGVLGIVLLQAIGRRDRRVLPAAPPRGIGLGRDHRPGSGRDRPGHRHRADDHQLHAHRQHRDLGRLAALAAAGRRGHRRRHHRAPARARALRRRPRPDRQHHRHGGHRALRHGRQRLTRPRRGADRSDHPSGGTARRVT